VWKKSSGKWLLPVCSAELLVVTDSIDQILQPFGCTKPCCLEAAIGIINCTMPLQVGAILRVMLPAVAVDQSQLVP